MTKRDDEWVRLAVQFQRALDRCKSEEDLHRVARKHPHELAAYQIAHDTHVRITYDSWLLSGEPDQAIANKTGLAPDLILTYEALYYDVRTNLQKTSWIMHSAIGYERHRLRRTLDRGCLQRFFAFIGGPIALEVFIGLRRPEKMPRTESELREFFRQGVRQTMPILAAIAACTLHVNQDSALKIIDFTMRLRAAEEQGDSLSDSDRQKLEAGVDEICKWAADLQGRAREASLLPMSAPRMEQPRRPALREAPAATARSA